MNLGVPVAKHLRRRARVIALGALSNRLSAVSSTLGVNPRPSAAVGQCPQVVTNQQGRALEMDWDNGLDQAAAETK